MDDKELEKQMYDSLLDMKNAGLVEMNAQGVLLTLKGRMIIGYSIEITEAFHKLDKYLIKNRNETSNSEVATALQMVREYMTTLIHDRVEGSYVPSQEEIAANNERVVEELREHLAQS